MSEWIDANDPVTLRPWVAPFKQPLAHASCKSGTRCTSPCVLCACVLFLANDKIGKTKEMLSFELKTAKLIISYRFADESPSD